MVTVQDLDAMQALTTKAHLKILQSRFVELKIELDAAFRESNEIQNSIDSFRSRCDVLQEDYRQSESEQEKNYKSDIDELKRQICRIREIIEKKKEERKSLIDSLNETKITERHFDDDLRNFNWAALKRLVLIPRGSNRHAGRKKKLAELSDLVSKARDGLARSVEDINYTKTVQERVRFKLGELTQYNELCKAHQDKQEQMIRKINRDNERLNFLLKQCATTHEPMSGVVSRSVRDKCHSFLESKNSAEVHDGLRKFKTRQSRIIKILKHKEMVLSRDLNSLQIARDETNDHADYYMSVIRNKRDEMQRNPLCDLRRLSNSPDISDSDTVIYPPETGGISANT